MVTASVDQSCFGASNFANSDNRLHGGQVVRSLVEGLELSLFVSYVMKYREKQQNGDHFGTFFAFYSEPTIQKPKLVVKDANPSVNDKLHSYTVTARPRFGAPFRF